MSHGGDGEHERDKRRDGERHPRQSSASSRGGVRGRRLRRGRLERAVECEAHVLNVGNPLAHVLLQARVKHADDAWRQVRRQPRT